ncbi:hypothetical protein F4810DRAFT_691878 [Camillea tinctor]|nr:hypothetical protein F4810DRAFT_691878 [Camillea tinctor]
MLLLLCFLSQWMVYMLLYTGDLTGQVSHVQFLPQCHGRRSWPYMPRHHRFHSCRLRDSDILLQGSHYAPLV